MSIGHSYVFFGEVSIQVLCPFFNRVVCLPGFELWKFFIYFGNVALIRCTVGDTLSPAAPVFVAVLFMTAGVWKPLKCPQETSGQKQGAHLHSVVLRSCEEEGTPKERKKP